MLTSPFASRWLDRLQVSLDWYRIEIDDAIIYGLRRRIHLALLRPNIQS